jgi:cytochrome c oxidase subunit III
MSSSHQLLFHADTLEIPPADRLPLGASWQKLMMWIFIVSDGLLFLTMLVGYGVIRIANPHWPDAGEVFHLSLIALMTFLLISSSATMGSAVAAAANGDVSASSRLIVMTLVGGLGFLGMQAYEWSSLISDGVSLTSNPWGVPLFGAAFFLITGFHGSHVLSGLVILAITLLRLHSGRSTAQGVELAGLYWHFIDLVWVFIFTLFYLI